MNVLVRRLAIGDEGKACDIVKAFKERTVSADYMRNFLSNGGNYLIAAYEGDELVGYVLGYKMDRIDRDSAMVNLYEIEVSEAFRKRGIGSNLIHELKRVCNEEGVMKIFLITNESNNAAMALYNSTGGVRDFRDDVLFNYRLM
jgi:ribosomal protein S18 acetylase RimI-like enzyme